MPRIFISYRRADSRTFTGRIYDRLVDAFGKDSLFMDVDDIPPGVDFRAYLQNEIAQADVVLVVIGSEWAKIMRQRRRQPNDFVRIELESALKRGKITIPVLLNGTPMPSPKDLPPRVDAVFPYLNAAQVRESPDFQRDMNWLINQLENWQDWPPPPPLPDEPEPSRRPSPVLLAGIAAVLAVLAIAGLVLLNGGDGDEPTGEPPTNAVAQQDTPRPTGEGPGVRATETLTITPTPTPTTTPTRTPTLSPAEQEATIQAEMDAILADEAATADAVETAIELTAQAQNRATAQAQTATATLWTPTPTIDVRATAAARLTQTREAEIAIATQNAVASATQFALDSTATATLWTPTPSVTPTLTPTPTSTSTPPPSPTATIVSIDAALAAWEASAKTNDDWESVIETFDGVEMVLVPPGCFEMGSEDGRDNEQPVHEICFDEPFWIDRYGVTNEQYGSLPEEEFCLERSSDPDQPRNCVDWFEARDFCVARGAQLPTEAQWEYAARGPDSLIYPWGNEWNGDFVVWSGNSDGQTAPIGSRPGSASWVGALDLSGNVWEWTSTIYDQDAFPYPYTADDGRENLDDDTSPRALRGGSFYNQQNFLRGAVRDWLNPSYTNNFVGFRCAVVRPPSQ